MALSFFRHLRAGNSDLAEFRTHTSSYVIVTCKYENDPIKTAEEKWQHRFSNYKSMGSFSDAQGR